MQPRGVNTPEIRGQRPRDASLTHHGVVADQREHTQELALACSPGTDMSAEPTGGAT
jgi:hypothetical protein